MPSILLIGRTGQLARALAPALAPLGHVTALSRSDLDLRDPAAIRAALRARAPAPALVINAAAYTVVDRAELEPAIAHAVNAVAPGVLAEECARMGAVLVHYSTDYVFDGTGAVPLTERDRTAPVNVYGESKLAGEIAVNAVGGHIIVRTSWIQSAQGDNFLTSIVGRARRGEALRVVADQTGSPTTAATIARATAHMIATAGDALRDHAGTYHVAARGGTTRYGLARHIVAALYGDDAPVSITPVSTAEYGARAPRPAYTVLDSGHFERVFSYELPTWEVALDEVLTGIDAALRSDAASAAPQAGAKPVASRGVVSGAAAARGAGS